MLDSCSSSAVSRASRDDESVANNLTASNPEEAYEFEVLVQTYLRDVHYSSQRQAIVNVIHSILNASFVVLPFAACEVGLPLFVVLIVGMSLISAYTSVILIRMANEQEVRTLEGLGEKAFGPKGFFVVCIFQIMFSVTLMIITLDVWGDIVPAVMRSILSNNSHNLIHGFWYDLFTRRESIIMIGGLMVLPICLFYRSMASLSWSSYLTVLTMFVAIASVIASFVVRNNDDPNYGEEVHTSSIVMVKSQFWMASIIIPISFSYNQKAFAVYNCVRRRNTKRWRYAVTHAHILIAVLYLIFGTFGYLTNAPDSVNGCVDQLNFFSQDFNVKSKVIDVTARLVIAVSLLLTFPVDCLVAVTTARRLIRRHHRYRKSKWNSNSHHSSMMTYHPHWMTVTSSMTGEGGLLDSQPSMQQLNDGESPEGVPSYRSNPSKYHQPYDNGQFRVLHNQSTACSHCWYSFWAAAFYPCTACIGRPAEDPADQYPFDQRKPMPFRSSQSPSEVGSERVYHRVSTQHDDEEEEEGEARTAKKLSQEDSLTTPLAPNRVPSSSKLSAEALQEQQLRLEQALLNSPQEPFDNLLRRTKTSNSQYSSSVQGRDSPHMSPSMADITDKCDAHVVHPQRMESDSDDDDESYLRDSVEIRPHSTASLNSLPSSVGGGTVRAGVMSPDPQEQQVTYLCCCRCTKNSFDRILNDMLPASILWTVAMFICAVVKHWAILAAALGGISTCSLSLLLPSMLYFRLGVLSDFQAIPVLGWIPNRFFMVMIQLLGLLLLFGSLAMMLYYSMVGFSDESLQN